MIRRGMIILYLIIALVVLVNSSDADSTKSVLTSPLLHSTRALKIAAVPTNSNCPDGHNEQDATLLGADALYNWGLNPPIVEGIMSIPMMFGRFEGCPEVGGNVNILLGFNEWDVSGQANMSKTECAEYWHQVEVCYPDYLLISPSSLNIHKLIYFYYEYRRLYGVSPRLDGLAIHCYDGFNPVGQCKYDVSLAQNLADSWGAELGVWVTEFAGGPPWDDDANWEAMTTLTPWLQTHTSGYAWFATRYKGDEWWATGWRSQLIECESGELTRLGEFFRDFKPRFYYPVVMR